MEALTERISFTFVNQHFTFKRWLDVSEFVDSYEKAGVGENYSVKCKNKLVDTAEVGGTHNLCFRIDSFFPHFLTEV